MTAHPYPWSRELWALLLDRLFNAGARVVMFDLVFNPPNEGDAIFREAVDRYRDRVVLGANFDAEHGMKFVMPNTSQRPCLSRLVLTFPRALSSRSVARSRDRS